ncbi:MAG: DUF2252 domain-containing protein [Desulfobacterales bacterium]|nr:DUF2252 domain-containing protein [Desulfobacterales bacterium]
MSGHPKTPEERHEYGKSLRDKTPLAAHAEWSPGPDRRDPVELVEEQNEGRVPWLVPVRRVRMAVSPFTFYRGSARIMATDLANTPVSGIETQICGDAHLSNFGSYASPERRLVFDLNDFDETLPGPWEWDVKRLAASFILAGRHNGLDKKETRKITQLAVRDYREAMAKLGGMRVTDVWYSYVQADRIKDLVEDRDLREDVARAINKTMRKDSRFALDKLAEEVDGQYRIRSEPPLLVPLRDFADRHDRDETREWLEGTLEKYLASVPDHVEHLLKKFHVKDFAVKVVGVGSVGTRCYTLLLEGRDRSDPLFLQIKQANKSVLEEQLGPSRYGSAGQRVVEGQRLMQTVSDIFLGHMESDSSGNDYYLRQLKDWKGSIDVEDVGRDELTAMARSRGWTLARSHARSGDPIAIAAYLGSSKTFDRAIVEFAERYADQAEEDHAAFTAQIESGALEAAEHEYV